MRIWPVLALALAACPAPSAGTLDTHISPAKRAAGSVNMKAFTDLHAAGKTAVLIDVRSPAEYAQGHVDGAILIPLPELPARLAELEPHRGEPIYVICQSGGRSSRGAAIMAQADFTAVNVEGGTGAWIAAGNPVVK